VSWDKLVRASRSASRDVSLPLTVTQVREIARFPDVPYPVVKPGPRPIDDPAVLAKCAETEAVLYKDLTARLSRTDRKVVYLYIHGFDTDFDRAVFRSAEFWHFFGRQGVPICYTWPAGRGLSGRGYVYDTVSCDFTVFHLKHLLRALGKCEQVEKVNILAHSRGTAVATTALVELQIEYELTDKPARERLKLGNVVLAAPDMDFDVIQQRLAGERAGYLPEGITIYTSPTDRALALADIMTLGASRLGQVRPMELTPRLRNMIEMSPVTFVEALVHSGYVGHSYYAESPAVSSDLILFLRDNRSPGAEHGRPLKERITNFWQVRDDYLQGK